MVSVAMCRLRTITGTDDISIHDMRRAVSNWLKDQSVSREVRDLILNHKDPSVTEAHYSNTARMERQTTCGPLPARMPAPATSSGPVRRWRLERLDPVPRTEGVPASDCRKALQVDHVSAVADLRAGQRLSRADDQATHMPPGVAGFFAGSLAVFFFLSFFVAAYALPNQRWGDHVQALAKPPAGRVAAPAWAKSYHPSFPGRCAQRARRMPRANSS